MISFDAEEDSLLPLLFQEKRSVIIYLNTTCVYAIISNLSPEDGINQEGQTQCHSQHSGFSHRGVTYGKRLLSGFYHRCVTYGKSQSIVKDAMPQCNIPITFGWFLNF